MSYDLYCYRPTSDSPDPGQAARLMEADAESEPVSDGGDPELKEKIAAALIEFDPRLERFVPDFGKIAALDSISEEQAQTRWRHIELNSPEGQLAVQFTIYDNHVDITTPYWYTGRDADRLFTELDGYLRVIGRTAGYFVYDPQTGITFDPTQSGLGDHCQYDAVAENLPRIVAHALPARKPWWKFW